FLTTGDNAGAGVSVAGNAQPVRPQPDTVSGNDGFVGSQLWTQLYSSGEILSGIDTIEQTGYIPRGGNFCAQQDTFAAPGRADLRPGVEQYQLALGQVAEHI